MGGAKDTIMPYHEVTHTDMRRGWLIITVKEKHQRRKTNANQMDVDDELLL